VQFNGAARAGRTAVITGAGSGIGLACARLAARLGMNLVLAELRQEALDAAVAALQAAGATVWGQRVDVSQAEQMEALAEATLQRFGSPHLVFNNAGVGSVGWGGLRRPYGAAQGRESGGAGVVLVAADGEAEAEEEEELPLERVELAQLQPRDLRPAAMAAMVAGQFGGRIWED
jgi:threonine dehydrogenase-like Zn-dependent dehydrogenase